MELEPIKQMAMIGGGVSGLILLLYFIFVFLFVNESKCSPSSFDDIKWKQVDYWWIVIGSLALIVHFIKVDDNTKIANRNMEESFGRVAIQSVNIAATGMSDSAICLGSTDSARNSLTIDNLAELDSACELFSKIKPYSRAGTESDIKVVIYLTQNTKAAKYTNPILIERADALYKAWANYLQQLDSINRISSDVSAYERTLEGVEYFAAVLLCIAIALRLAKVTGEIRLKTRPIRNTGWNLASIPELDGVSYDLKESARELSLSVRELSVSAGNISNAVGRLTNTSKQDALETKLSRIETLMLRHYWITGIAVIVVGVIIVSLQRFFAGS